MKHLLLLLCSFAGFAQQSQPQFDLLIRNGSVVDGSGSVAVRADVGITGDRIVAIGDLNNASAKQTIDATGKIVSPGFIDMLGWSWLTIFADNRAASKISQGITTEICGEGSSPAPVNENITNERKGTLEKYNIAMDWTDLNGYFAKLERNKSAINIAALVGATQVREFVIGYDDRKPTTEELEQMKQLVRKQMEQGALGVSTSLIYAPATYAKTDELVALAKVVGEFGGMYLSHIRDEGDDGHQREAIEEVATICRAANISAEIWHLKCAGKAAWGDMPKVVAQIQKLRDEGVSISADVYPYIASSNGLDATLPSWVQDGGSDKMLQRLKSRAVRTRMTKELKTSNQGYGVNFEGIMIASTSNPALKQYEGKRLADIAKEWKKDRYETLFDFILKDSARTGKVTFSMSENDLREAMKQPWTSFCTDANARALDGPMFEGKPHPRSYGSMARVLGKYVREEKFLALEEAIRKMTSQPAQRVGLKNRGLVKENYFADLVVFDPLTIKDKATFEEPHQYSEGISQTIVNGKVVWENGRPTGELSGRPLRKNRE